jgi:hypothetical protein
LPTSPRASATRHRATGHRSSSPTRTRTSLFAGPIYARGALTLHALRTEIGDDRFVRLLRTWHDRYAGDDATTEEFVALANEIAGRDLGAFFDRWLYRSELPESLLPEPAEPEATPGSEAALVGSGRTMIGTGDPLG